MAGPESIVSIATGFWKPLLIQPTSLLPLYDLGSVIPALACNIQTESIDGAFDDNAFALPDKMPSLIPSLVLLPLDYALSLFVGCPGDIDHFVRVVVDDDRAILDSVVIFYQLESEHLCFRIWIKLPKS